METLSDIQAEDRPCYQRHDFDWELRWCPECIAWWHRVTAAGMREVYFDTIEQYDSETMAALRI